ncbi:MAG: pyridoxamine 5'-phosphate oxidase family protein [Candidatus Limnocylindria bacterium]
MVSWAAFEAEAPELAAEGRRLIYSRGDGEALLATVRGDGLPRIHPVNVGIVGEGLFTFILASPKLRDLQEDRRFAFHTHQDPAAPNEFMVRGRARHIEPGAARDAVAAAWYFSVDATYALFELSLESALLGVRIGPDEWPPRYSSWKAQPGSGS